LIEVGASFSDDQQNELHVPFKDTKDENIEEENKAIEKIAEEETNSIVANALPGLAKTIPFRLKNSAIGSPSN
jgi:hypothetical protein